MARSMPTIYSPWDYIDRLCEHMNFGQRCLSEKVALMQLLFIGYGHQILCILIDFQVILHVHDALGCSFEFFTVVLSCCLLGVDWSTPPALSTLWRMRLSLLQHSLSAKVVNLKFLYIVFNEIV